MSTRITVKEASDRLAEGWTYIDVRTVEEFEAGHPPGAVNVPIALSAPGGMAPNPHFLRVMKGAFPTDAKLVVGCKAGGRSQRAAGELVQAGFTGVLEMRPGWDGARDPFGQLTEPGWSREGLPIETGRPAGRSWDEMQSKGR
jgi:rhodanese-related sulfurtransferase